jgi:choline dehydrogenase-like flavoprotein
VSTEGQLNNKYRSRCLGRGRCSRGCDVNANFHSPAALVYPARDTGNLTIRPYSVVSEVFLDEATGKAGGVRVIDANTKEVMDFKARVVVLGAGTLDSTRILLNSKSPKHPNGLGNSSGLMGCYSASTTWARGQRLHPDAHGHRGHPGRRAPDRALHPALPQRDGQAPRLHPRYHFQGGGGAYEYPSLAHDMPASARRSSRTSGSTTRRCSRSAASARSSAQGEPRLPRRGGQGRLGHPGLRFDFRFRDNEIKMARDMADTADEMLRAAGAENIKIDPTMLPEGWSIHEIGTARMGETRRPRSRTSSAACTTCRTCSSRTRRRSCPAAPQNTTWSILAFCWRTMDYVKEQMRTGVV